MKNVRINQVMLSFLVYVSIIVASGFLFGKPENIEKYQSFMYAVLLMNGIGIASFFMRKKDKYFRHSFLSSYFGVILFLLALNVTNIIYDSSVNVIVSLLIIGILLYQAVYPFLERPLLSGREQS